MPWPGEGPTEPRRRAALGALMFLPPVPSAVTGGKIERRSVAGISQGSGRSSSGTVVMGPCAGAPADAAPRNSLAEAAAGGSTLGDGGVGDLVVEAVDKLNKGCGGGAGPKNSCEVAVDVGAAFRGNCVTRHVVAGTWGGAFITGRRVGITASASLGTGGGTFLGVVGVELIAKSGGATPTVDAGVWAPDGIVDPPPTPPATGQSSAPPLPPPPPQQSPAGPGWLSSSNRSNLPPGPPKGGQRQAPSRCVVPP